MGHQWPFSPPHQVCTGSKEDLLADYFSRKPASRDQAAPTSYVSPTVKPCSHKPGQSVKPSPRQPVGQSPSSGPPAAQRSGQALNRAFSLASADLLRSNGPDACRLNEEQPEAVRRQGGGANGRERPLSARLAADQHGDGGRLTPPIHHSASLDLPTERDRERGRAAACRNHGEVAMVTPVRAATAPDDASGRGQLHLADSALRKKEKERARGSSVERPKSTPASPDPDSDPQTVWYEYGCV